jgi:DNA-binding response OmpR family regulator
MDAGADDYLIKPFSAREADGACQQSLQDHSLRKEALESVRRSEAELARQVAEFETLFRECPSEWAWPTMLIARLIRINPALAELLGVSETINPAQQRAKGTLPYGC